MSRRSANKMNELLQALLEDRSRAKKREKKMIRVLERIEELLDARQEETPQVEPGAL